MSGEVVDPSLPGAGREPAGKPLCGAKKRDGSGQTCRLVAGHGTDHVGTGPCRKHGGNTRNHVVAAQREVARQAVATFGLPLRVDPQQALLGEVWRTAGAVAWLDEVVRALPPEQAVWGVTEEATKDSGEFPGVDTTRKAVPNVWVDLWQRERKHLVDVCKAALAAGVEERLVRLAESHGAQLAAVIREFVARLDLDPARQARVPEALQQAIAAVTGGPVLDGEAA